MRTEAYCHAKLGTWHCLLTAQRGTMACCLPSFPLAWYHSHRICSPFHSFSRGSVFSAEIVDEQGTAIEATFWREVRAGKTSDSRQTVSSPQW